MNISINVLRSMSDYYLIQSLSSADLSEVEELLLARLSAYIDALCDLTNNLEIEVLVHKIKQMYELVYSEDAQAFFAESERIQNIDDPELGDLYHFICGDEFMFITETLLKIRDYEE